MSQNLLTKIKPDDLEVYFNQEIHLFELSTYEEAIAI
jgi:hypothetical protein